MYRALKPALYIAEREIRDQLRDWRIIFPILGLTIFFPFLMNFTANQILGFVNRYGATIIGERLIPFLLMIVGFFPISVSLVIALETFVGEKERGSIEPLLNTPLKDWQLYLGKLLSATVYPLVSSYIGMGVYLLGLVIEHIPLPGPEIMLLVIVLTMVQAYVMVAGAVVVSTQATSVRAANLLASFIIIPSALLVQGESILMFWGTYQSLWFTILGLLILGFLLVRLGLAHFQREELLGKEIDVLNVRWIISVFWQSFTGGVKNIKQWYVTAIPKTIKKLWRPSLFVSLLIVGGIIVGITQVQRFSFSLGDNGISQVNSRLQDFVKFFPFFSLAPALLIFWQNIRVIFLAMILGAISFGILGVLPVFATMAVVGYLGGILVINGLPALNYLSFILPHGIIEIPATILATAAVVQIGAILATPSQERTVGEVWLSAIGEWAQIFVGVVIPLLFVGACVEAWITPRIVVLFVH
jgi:uncharacterized membrane protein SpoIIM required for sporulation/ABC-type transport system involved in multi-copper enzyme maturation permease subunit